MVHGSAAHPLFTRGVLLPVISVTAKAQAGPHPGLSWQMARATAAAHPEAGRASDEAERKLAVAGVADEHTLLEGLRAFVSRVHRCAHLRRKRC